MTCATPAPDAMDRKRFLDSLLPVNSLSTGGSAMRAKKVATAPVATYPAPVVTRSALAERVATVLARRRLTQGELCDQAGIDPAILSRLLSGKRPGVSSQTVGRMARTLGVSVDWLTTGEGSEARTDDQEEDRYPERARAIRAAQVLGVHPRAVEFAAALYLPNGEDFDAKWWLDMILAADSKLKQGKTVP